MNSLISTSTAVTVVVPKDIFIEIRDITSSARITYHSKKVLKNNSVYSYKNLWPGTFEIINDKKTIRIVTGKNQNIDIGDIKVSTKVKSRVRGKAVLGNIIMKPFAKTLFNLGWEKTLKEAKKIITVCRYLAKEAEKKTGNKTAVCPIGIDKNDFKNGKKISVKHPSVCIIQNHQIKQKSEALIEFTKVIKGLPEIYFYISKGLPENWNSHNHQKVMGVLSKLDNVELVNINSSNKYDYLSACDIYVLASGLDCTPATILEAGLASKPIIASNAGGIPEMIINGVTGWTIENGNTEEWEKRIRELSQNPTKAKKNGEKFKKSRTR